MILYEDGKVLSYVDEDDIKSGVLTVPESVEYITASFKSIATKIEKLVLPNVKIILKNTFCGSNVKEVIAPNLKKICAFAFADCKELEVVKSPKLEVIEDNAFKGCFNLKSIDLLFIKEIGENAFEYSDNLYVFDDLCYSKIGFNKGQSNYSIINYASEQRKKLKTKQRAKESNNSSDRYKRIITQEQTNTNNFEN